MEQNPLQTLGLDLGDRFTHYCLLDASGTRVDAGRVSTSSQAISRLLEPHSSLRVILEVGAHSPWVSRLLARLGHDVIVANPRRLHFIFAAENKRDRVDAEALARVGRLDPALLYPVVHRGLAAQKDLALLRGRDALVRARTRLVNHVRGVVKAAGGRLPRCSTRTFTRKVQEHIPEGFEEALAAPLAMIEELTAQIRALDHDIEQRCREDYPETFHLRQVAGVGPITALAFVLVLEDPNRFPRSRTVGAYLGLRPRLDESGSRQPQLRITKSGDQLLRSLLVQSAQYILGPFGPDCDLRRWGLGLAQRGGKRAKKQAVVAVARKLAGLLWHLWRTAEAYEPLHNQESGPRAA